MKPLRLAATALLVLAFAEVYGWVFVPELHVGPSFKEADPTLGLRTKRDAQGIRYSRDYVMHWHTGAQGYRAETVTGPKAPGTLRIVSTGDSFSFGVGVEDDETYAVIAEGLLQARLDRPVDIINAGTTDAGIGEFLRRFDEFEALDPDLLVLRLDHLDFKNPGAQWQFTEGAPPTPRVFPEPGLLSRVYGGFDKSFLAYSGFLSLTRGRLNSILIWTGVALCRLPRLHTATGVDTCVPGQGNQDERTWLLLDRFLERAHEAELPLVVLLYDLKSEGRLNQARATLAGERVIDLSQQLAEPGNVFAHDGHMTAKAHAETAGVLAKEVVDWLGEGG